MAQDSRIGGACLEQVDEINCSTAESKNEVEKGRENLKVGDVVIVIMPETTLDIGHWEEWKKYFRAKMEKSESFVFILPASLTSGRFIDCASSLLAQMIEVGIQCVQTHWGRGECSEEV